METRLFAAIVCAALTGFAYGDELPLNPADQGDAAARGACWATSELSRPAAAEIVLRAFGGSSDKPPTKDN
jgi:hypothetical protein